MGGYFAEERGVYPKVEADNIKLAEPLKSAPRRTDIVVDHIAFFPKLEVSTDKVLANIS